MAEEQYTVKLYKRRWLNLLLFIIYANNNGIHCAQFSVINDSISSYYNVPHTYVEWTTGIFTLSYVVFSTPGLYAMEKIKLRYIMIIASFLSTTGSWMKVFSVAPDRFLFAFIAQAMIALSFSFVIGGSAHLIAAWFGANETSLASALSLVGDQFGTAGSFIIPVMLVRKSLDINIWEDSLRRMHIGNAVISTIVFALITLLFQNDPKYPPSNAQAMKIETKSENFMKSFKKILKNRAFLMLLVWYSFCSAMLTINAATLGEIITMNFPDAYEDAGKLGFIMIGGGMVATPLFGYFMDKTHKFKEAGIIHSTGVFITYLLFNLALKSNNILYVYIAITFWGAFAMSSFINGIQIGIEILYPISEDKCSTVMVFMAQLFTFISLVIYGAVLRKYGDIVANSGICIFTFIGSIISFFGPVPLNRQKAEKAGKAKELKQFLT